MTLYQIGPKGLQKVDVPANHLKNNLPVGTVLYWGGNVSWPAQKYAVVGKRDYDGSLGHSVFYNLVSLETYKKLQTEGTSIKTQSDETWHSQHFFLTDEVLSADEVLDTLAKADEAESAAERAKIKKADDRAAEIERIKRENPGLVQQDGNTSSHALGAKNIKKELKKAFPKVKFSVKSDSFSGGNSIDVRWTDGPTSKEVEKITSKYQQGSFDGMVDLYEYNRDNYWPEVFGGAKYVQESRSCSTEFFNKVAAELGYPEAAFGENGEFSGVDYETSQAIKREAWNKNA